MIPLIVACIALVFSAFAANHNRLLWHWTRDGRKGPMPSLWQLRDRRGP